MSFCIILTLFQEVSSLHSKRFAGNSARTVCMVRRTNWWQFPNNICGGKSLNAGSLQIEAMYVKSPLRALSLARSPRRNRLNLPVFNTVPTTPVKWNATEASSMLMIKGQSTVHPTEKRVCLTNLSKTWLPFWELKTDSKNRSRQNWLSVFQRS